MNYLLDTGVLLRLTNRADALHPVVREAVRALASQQHVFFIAVQNIAEFWNVSTRPSTSRGGLGLSVERTSRWLRLIERRVKILFESPTSFAEWKSLVLTRRVLGVQVHDVRLVAIMKTQAVTHVLTLNDDDFRRFPEITVVHPRSVLSPKSTTEPAS